MRPSSPESDFASAQPAMARRFTSPFLRPAAWAWMAIFSIAFNGCLAIFGNDFFSRVNPRIRPMPRGFGVADERGWNAFRDWRRLDRGHHIIWIGDSVSLGGRTPADRTFCALLEKELRGQFPHLEISVDNFSVGGANPPEKLALLRNLRLPRNAIVVLQVRHDEFAYGTTGFLSSTAWLQDWFRASEDSLPVKSVSEGLSWIQRKEKLEESLERKMEACIPVFRFRERLNMFLWGGPEAAKTLLSRDRFRQAAWLPDSMAAWLTRKSRYQTWTPERWNKARYDQYRKEHPFRIDPDTAEYLSLLAMLRELQRTHPDYSLVYLCPSNPLLLKTGLDPSEYQDDVKRQFALLQSYSRGALNLFESLSNSAFYDNFHLTDDGHREMAKLFLPILVRKMQEIGWVTPLGERRGNDL